MLIISRKKDYYDGVVGSMGVDKTIVYDRVTTILEESEKFPKEFQPNKSWSRRKENHFINLSHFSNYPKTKYLENASFIVGFCGKLYIGWKLYCEFNVSDMISPLLVTEITYDFEYVKKHVKTTTWGSSNLNDDVEYVKNYNAIEVFRTLKTPIFIYDYDYNRTSINVYRKRSKCVFIINPNLSEYEFYTVFDSFQAFQEVQMFMGGVLGKGEKDIVEVADKYKIEQHGFDYKYSFRKDKEKT